MGQAVLTVTILLFGEHNWRWSFLAESALLIGLVAFTFICIPGRYFSQGKEHDVEKREEGNTVSVSF